MTYDQETGEVYANGSSTATRAAMSAAGARIQMERDRQGYGANVLHAAIAQALHDIPVWIQNTKDGAHKVKYAPLKDILAAVRPPLMDRRIRIRQGAEPSRMADEGGGMKGRLVPVYTDLIHVDTGLMDRTIIEIPLIKLDAQSMGSAITYGRRYTLLAALGLATDEADDDGMAAKSRDLNAKTQVSADLETLIIDLRGQKDITSLTKWGSDAKNRRRIDDLTEGEAERLRIAYSDHREKLNAE